MLFSYISNKKTSLLLFAEAIICFLTVYLTRCVTSATYLFMRQQCIGNLITSFMSANIPKVYRNSSVKR